MTNCYEALYSLEALGWCLEKEHLLKLTGHKETNHMEIHTDCKRVSALVLKKMGYQCSDFPFSAHNHLMSTVKKPIRLIFVLVVR